MERSSGIIHISPSSSGSNNCSWRTAVVSWKQTATRVTRRCWHLLQLCICEIEVDSSCVYERVSGLDWKREIPTPPPHKPTLDATFF